MVDQYARMAGPTIGRLGLAIPTLETCYPDFLVLENAIHSITGLARPEKTLLGTFLERSCKLDGSLAVLSHVASN